MKIIDSDAFIDMPTSARLLYFDLCMRADDDGFINSPKKIMKMTGASADDLSVLILRKFIIDVGDGVVVIKHWRIHNYIAKDRYVETTYKEKKAQLAIDENNCYSAPVYNLYTECIQPVYADKNRLDKNRLDKNIGASEDAPRTRFVKPTVDDVQAYCKEKGISIDPQRFVDYYTANGWKVGKSSMKDWKAAVRNWWRNDKGKTFSASEMDVPEQDIDELRAKLFGKGNADG